MISSAPQKTSRWEFRSIPISVTILILWLAAGLRFYQLDKQSFWNDEGNSARLSERSLDLIIEGTASDIHPPLYYILLRGWRELLGEHEFGLRSFSAFTGLLTVAAVFALARQFLTKSNSWPRAVWLVSLAGFLAAVNPALIYYSRETRMYAQLALLAALSTIILWRWLNAEQRWPWTLAYLFLVASGLYTHYFFPAVLIFQFLIILFWAWNYFINIMFSPFEVKSSISVISTMLSWVGMMVVVFLLYAPWLPIFFQQTGGRMGQRGSILEFAWASIRWLAFGETIAAGELVWPTAAVILLAVWAIFSTRRRSVVPLLGALVPVAAMYVTGATLPAFFKFLLAGVPFFVLLLAGSIVESDWQRIRPQKLWLVPPILLLLVLGGTAVSLNNLYRNPAFARADYRGMVARIAADDHTNIGIILNAPNQWEVFTYYHRQGAPVYPLPKGQPDPSIIEPQLNEIIQKHDRLYVLYWGENQRDPQGVIEKWLDAHTFKASEEWVGDVRFVIYAVPDEAAQMMETATSLNFGDRITLNGFTLNSQNLQAGDILQVTLFWEAQAKINQRYKVFLHLLDDQGHLIAQHDGEPGGGNIPTLDWQPGETIVDNHGLLLPIDLSPGTYHLVLGLYDIADPNLRLPVISPNQTQDFWEVGTITVE